MKAVATFLPLWALVLGARAGGLEATVDPRPARPGEVLVVEVRGASPRDVVLSFRGRDYPLYAAGPERLRALIGLSAESPPGAAEVELTRRRLLLPDQVLKLPVEVVGRAFTPQAIRLPKKKLALPAQPEAKTALGVIRASLIRETELQRWKGPFLRPASGRLSSRYGHPRTVNRDTPWDWHKGLDIAAPKGAAVTAPAAGLVVLAGRYPVQGGTIVLDHGQGVMSALLHLDTLEVSAGDEVEAGARVATVGAGGFSTGAHLHWGLYVHADPVDPEPWLEREY